MHRLAPRRVLLVLALLAAVRCASAGGAGAPPPPPGPPPAAKSLFTEDAPLRLAVEAPWSQIARDRGSDEERSEFPGVLRYDGPEGPVQLDVKVRTRGRARLSKSVCSFPPLRLEFDKAQAKGTLFQGQKKLKLVTHCKATPAYEQVALQEQLAYRAYQLLADESFRTRLAWIRYVDSGGGAEVARYAFFLEPAEDVAKRAGTKLVEEHEVDPARIDSPRAALVELFMYMVGNTDFSLRMGEPDEPCCHNALHLVREGGRTLPVPYDFDYSGVVDAPYALPDERLGLRSVTQRLYRGYCRPAEDTARAIALLQEKRGAIEALYRGAPALDPAERDRALAYYGEFFDTVADPKKRESELVCMAPKASSG